jgi:hypothetical protein
MVKAVYVILISTIKIPPNNANSVTLSRSAYIAQTQVNASNATPKENGPSTTNPNAHVCQATLISTTNAIYVQPT